MHPDQQSRFDLLYQKHLTALKLRGLAPKTIDAYSRAVRRLAEHLDRCPNQISHAELDLVNGGQNPPDFGVGARYHSTGLGASSACESGQSIWWTDFHD